MLVEPAVGEHGEHHEVNLRLRKALARLCKCGLRSKFRIARPAMRLRGRVVPSALGRVGRPPREVAALSVVMGVGVRRLRENTAHVTEASGRRGSDVVLVGLALGPVAIESAAERAHLLAQVAEHGVRQRKGDDCRLGWNLAVAGLRDSFSLSDNWLDASC